MCLSSSPTAGLQPCTSAFGQEGEGFALLSDGPWIRVPRSMTVSVTPWSSCPVHPDFVPRGVPQALPCPLCPGLWQYTRVRGSLSGSAPPCSSPGTQDRVNTSVPAFSFSNLVARQNVGIYGLRLGPSLRGWLEELALSGSCCLAAKPSGICQFCTASAIGELRQLLQPPLPSRHDNFLCNLCWRQQHGAGPPAPSTQLLLSSRRGERRDQGAGLAAPPHRAGGAPNQGTGSSERALGMGTLQSNSKHGLCGSWWLPAADKPFPAACRVPVLP